jgi:hypothetical protein
MTTQREKQAYQAYTAYHTSQNQTVVSWESFAGNVALQGPWLAVYDSLVTDCGTVTHQADDVEQAA